MFEDIIKYLFRQGRSRLIDILLDVDNEMKNTDKIREIMKKAIEEGFIKEEMLAGTQFFEATENGRKAISA